MKKRLKRIISAVLTCIVLFSLIPAIRVSADNNANIQKLPDSYVAQAGSFTITANSRFLLVSESEPTAEQKEFAQFISQQFAGAELPSKTTLPVVWGPENYKKAGDIVLIFDSSLAAEGYKVVVDSNNITITGADKRGQMYGAFMVIKTMRANNSKTISGCTIQDTPDAEERTVLLDCGRKYFTAEWIKNYIKEMAYMGYNTLDFHFAEDQGFRLDIWDEKYFTSSNKDENGKPNDFSWICGGMVFDRYYGYAVNGYCGGIYGQVPYPDEKKYLTTEEVIEILQVAKQYQIDVVPSFDSPMHCQYLRRIWTAHVGGSIATELVRDGNRYTDIDKNYSFVYNNKKYSSAGITSVTNPAAGPTSYSSWDNWTIIQSRDNAGTYNTGTKTINITNAVARNLLLAITQDFADFFKKYGSCTEFNICADEVAFYTNDWWGTYAQDVLNISNGTKYDTYINYINELSGMLESKYGYKVRMFNDFVDVNGTGNYAQHVTFNPNLEIVYWTVPESSSTTYAVSINSLIDSTGNKYKVYNALENYNYFVLNLHEIKEGVTYADDRSGSRGPWSHIDADEVYNNWNPTVFTYPGKTANVVSANKVSGGYFLIWSDYASMNTEAEIWNGIDANGKYNVIERMWSNVTKMWNYDVNSSLSYSNFAALRTEFEHFPGYSGDCTAENTLPAAKTVTRAYLADHTALKELLAQKIDGSIYNQESWSNYEAARAEAVKVDENYGATQAELEAAVANLQSAIDNLSTKTYIADHTKLVALLEKSFDENAYTPSSWQNYLAVYAAGETVHKNYDATQDEVDTATSNLQAAIDGLTPRADFSELIAQLERSFSESSYTEDSWADYKAAREAALTVRGNLNATQKQVNEAIESLIAAIEGLQSKPFLTIQHWTSVGGENIKFDETYKGAPEAEAGKSFSIEIPGRPGYDLISVENCRFVPYSSGADGGYITGYFTEPATVKIWYTNMPETKQLETLTKADYDSSAYSNASWKAYEDAIAAAEAFLAEVSASPSNSTYQEQIQEHVEAVLAARNALETAKPVAETKILDLKVPATTVAKGKKAILVITTTTDVKEITVDGVNKFADYYSQPAVVNGQAVKLWYITFRINALGTEAYTVHAGSATQTVNITCK